jgi:L-fuculose-phosphate aldolase
MPVASDTEEEARRSVVDAARSMSRSGLVAATWGNVSARVAGGALAVITPSGVEYDALEPEMLCLVEVATGAVVGGKLRPSSELPMHLGIYRAREDVGGVVHTHSVYASAHAALRVSVPPLIEDMAQVVGGAVECSAYARAGTAALADAVVAALGERNAALLANHGLVGVGRTPHEALRVCLVAERGAWIHFIARSMGDPVVLSREEADALHRDFVTSYGQRHRS